LAFTRVDAKSNNRSVIISNLDGSGEYAALTVPPTRNLNSPDISWSPDGSTISLAASPEDNQSGAGIFLLQVAEGQLKPLTKLTRGVELRDAVLVSAAP
jgi:Tol biopolymer transport system component